MNNSYATSNNIQADEAGLLRQGPGGYFLAKHGSYSFTGPDGIQYTVTYTADENGFKAEDAHIPKPLHYFILHNLKLMKKMNWRTSINCYSQKWLFL